MILGMFIFHYHMLNSHWCFLPHKFNSIHSVHYARHWIDYYHYIHLLLRVCLLECSVREVRVVVASILEKTLESALHFGDPGLDSLTDALLSLLDKDVPENVKNCAQYFGLFSNFAQRVIKSTFLLCWVFKVQTGNQMNIRWVSECFVFLFSRSGMRSLSVVIETLSLSPDAHLPIGTQ